MKPPNDDSAAEWPEDLRELIEDFEKFFEDGNRKMSAKWRYQTFRSLLEVWDNSDSEWGSSNQGVGYQLLASNVQRDFLMAKSYEVQGYEVLALRNRYQDIMNMMERNRIWPPPVSSWSHEFRAALREVLSRLPQEAFDEVGTEFNFVLDEGSSKMLALNAPVPSPAPFRTIIFFRTSMHLSKQALIGLIAHEIARNFVHNKDCEIEEMLAEKKAREWGFGAELDCKEIEKERLNPNKSRRCFVGPAPTPQSCF